jgi:superfamily II DNA or RNA helicase
MARRFNSRQRVALYLAAGGHCSRCGTELEPGWHGDHIKPHSAGGPTDVINGQPLCPTCNLKKGNRYMQLRAWQEDAIGRFLRNNEDFLAVATPGAGKTTFALTGAKMLIDRGDISRIIVVVPTAHLRNQWAQASAKAGIQLDNTFANGNTVIARDYDGTVVTYATVAAQPQLWRRLSTQEGTLVVLDEVHHAGEADHLSWGPALTEAFGPAYRRLLLSGTPFRSDGRPIPFVTYDQGKCVPSINYDYGTALADRDVVRPIAFPALDGKMRWRDAGTIVTADLSTVDEKQLARALDTAYDPTGEWIRSVLRRANVELTRLREETPDAGGLIVAADQHNARQYAGLLKRITGEMPVVAISDEPDASDLIKAYAKGSQRWIVAVQMVSEGVDIPRLALGVYASRISTEMFFRQVVGRFVRMRGAEDETTATLFVPSIEPLLSYARDIERTVEAVLAEEERELRERAEKGPQQTALTFDLVEPLDSTEATHHSTIFRAETFSDIELSRAENAARQAGMPSAVTPEMMAHALRLAGAGRIVGTATVAAPVPEQARTLAEEKASLRKLITRKVGQLQRRTEVEFSHIHSQLNRRCGDTAKTATTETLNKRLELLDQWLEEV